MSDNLPLSGIRWMKYTLPSGRDIYLTQRPDSIEDHDSLAKFLAEKSPCVRIHFCDDWVEPPPHGPEWYWLPWMVGRDLQVENVFAFMSLFKRYDDRNFLNKPIWLHCDSSTMRAPTHFGLWLRSNYSLPVCKKIVANVEFQPERPDGVLYENPLDYSKWSIARDPHIRGLVKAWKVGGEEAACGFVNAIHDRKGG